jgi:hypothetical protein
MWSIICIQCIGHAMAGTGIQPGDGLWGVHRDWCQGRVEAVISVDMLAALCLCLGALCAPSCVKGDGAC